jgi:hypothetical protein
MRVKKFQKKLFLASLAMIIALILFSSCSERNRHQRPILINSSVVKESGNNGPCYNIQGYVLGTISPGAEVFFFRCQSLEYATVMQTVRTAIPIQNRIVNDAARFNISCLNDGNYTAMIPATSYINGSVGSPLPVEFNTTNGYLDIAFQGGDSDYLVCAFSIVTLNK